MFDAFAKDCASKPGCALGTDPGQATARFQQLTRPLLTKPIPLPDGRELSFGDAQQGTIQALYATSQWPDLRQGLTELAQGTGQTLMGLADELLRPRARRHLLTRRQDAFNAVRCVDDPQIKTTRRRSPRRPATTPPRRSSTPAAGRAPRSTRARSGRCP